VTDTCTSWPLALSRIWITLLPAVAPKLKVALARPLAGREDHGEFRRNFGIFGDDLHPAIRHVGNHAVARQRPGPELNLGKVSARTTFALAAIR